ncbi:hypothetical protein BGZ99_001127 [Dissophora globulifera]|uniref:F-box domain-containing protein n=1 Tax=Dissophora globulifera TaxID=979702 RepID=A0A9P6RQX2_9FUNG|nr:hypothetical protein BGZ99_001127 [Dissophora globulifera]
MQLQAERDHFVHAGIGGGCSSPSSSSPEDSVLSHVKVKNLKKPKKPKAKSRDGDKEKDVRRDVGQLNSGASSTTKAKTAISPIVTEHRALVMSDTEAADRPGGDLSRDTTATATTLPLARYIPLPPNHPAPVISAASAAKTMPTAPSAAPVSAILATTDTFLSKPVHMRIVSQHKETDLTASRQEDDIVVIPTALTKSRLSTKTTSDSLLPSATQTPAADYFSSLLQRTLTEPCLPVYESEAAASLTQVLGCDRLSRLPSELLFNILCRLDALDLSRMAQVNKFCGRMASDNGLWRVKSMQHSLYSKRHLQGRQGVMPWLAYYKFLHQKSLVVKQNWADARPQAVYVLEGHTGLVSSLEMSMWSLVTGSIDSTLRVWDLRTQNCLRVIRASQPLTCVSHSVKAGAACARTSFGGLCIWDIQTGELILQDDTAMPQIASFMYMDERYIGYGQTDGGVTVFDWSSRVALEVVGTYHAHDGDVIHISVLDHKYVLSVSTNGETLVYSLKLACIVEKILLPHAAQAIPFTPTIHGDKVMFSTRDAVYESARLAPQTVATLHHNNAEPAYQSARKDDIGSSEREGDFRPTYCHMRPVCYTSTCAPGSTSTGEFNIESRRAFWPPAATFHTGRTFPRQSVEELEQLAIADPTTSQHGQSV